MRGFEIYNKDLVLSKLKEINRDIEYVIRLVEITSELLDSGGE